MSIDTEQLSAPDMGHSPEERAQKKIALGMAAEELLENPTLKAAFFEIETQMLHRMASPPERVPKEERDWAYFMIQAQYELRRALARFVRAGQAEVSMKLADEQRKQKGNGRGRGRSDS